MTITTAAEANSINPATGEFIASHPFLDETQARKVLETAEEGFQQWKRTTATDRCRSFTRMAELLRRDSERLSELVTAEVGKPITQSRTEVEKAASALDWYAENGAAMIADTPVPVGAGSYISYLPLGPILAVEPWNFPIWQVIRGGISILLGGNGYVLKPAPNTVGCAVALEELWMKAGLPEGAFIVLNAEPLVVSVAIADPVICGVTVTGSTGAGSAIAAQAGHAIKKTVLELGGTDAFIVLADADIDNAVEAAVKGRFENTGQVCIAAKRIILEEPIEAEFTRKFVAKVATLVMGDPMSESTYIGPVARPDIRDAVANQVSSTVAEGGKLLIGGRTVSGIGNYFEPTVIGNVKPGMTAFEDEIFGPVAALISAKDIDDAVALANNSQYGLNASIWTLDIVRALEIARRLEVGGVFINRASASDPRIPIGGIKKSGFGRELSHFGVHEFSNVQAVWIENP